MRHTTNRFAYQAVGLFHLKLGCLLYWACWFSLAFLTNVFDFIHAMTGLSSDWHFRSGNYVLLSSTLSLYHTSGLFLNFLFICNMAVQGLSAVLFFSAGMYFWRRHRYTWPCINLAFTISIALWAVFLIMEEIFIAYAFEGGHSRLFIFELVTLLSIHLLPNK
jgi:hypothetical protein